MGHWMGRAQGPQNSSFRRRRLPKIEEVKEALMPMLVVVVTEVGEVLMPDGVTVVVVTEVGEVSMPDGVTVVELASVDCVHSMDLKTNSPTVVFSADRN